MKIFWMGHSSFRIEICDAVILIDPWLTGNPVLAADRHDEAITGATHILITHGHFDHATDAADIATRLGIPIVGIPELVGLLAESTDIETTGFNKGGTISLGQARVSMVQATHSSSIGSGKGTIYAGTESGYMISGEGHMIYVSGDTDVMADMDWMGDFYKPDVGILCAGGHYTMDMARAAYAAKRYFNFTTLIPCHYGTFPLLEQSAQELIDKLPDVNVIEPQILEPISL